MQSNELKDSPVGRLVPIVDGHRAFVPNSLPRSTELSPPLISQLDKASLAVGTLAGVGETLANPHLLIRPFVSREAVLSSRIEGTQATLGELLAAEAGAAVERSPADLREVGNYVVALEHGIGRLRTLPLSLRLVRELHEKLMHACAASPPHPVGSAAAKTGLVHPDPLWPAPPTSRHRPTSSWSISVLGKRFCTTRACRRSSTRRSSIHSSRRFTRSWMATDAWGDSCLRC